MSLTTHLMTGATSGFGKVVAQHVVKSPCNFIFFARSEKKSNKLHEELRSVAHETTNIHVFPCDFKSLQSVKDACDAVLSKFSRIDTLIQNAGMMSFEFAETADGIEETLQVNLLAPMLITAKLSGLLPKDATAKLLYTASALHQGTIDFENLESRKKFSSFKAYRQSKLGVILMTRLQAQQENFNNVKVVAIHPGIIRTELSRNAGWFSKLVFYIMGSSLEKGARTHIHLLDANPDDIVSGEYYAKSKVKKITEESNDLDLARKLEARIQDYLADYLKSSK